MVISIIFRWTSGKSDHEAYSFGGVEKGDEQEVEKSARRNESEHSEGKGMNRGKCFKSTRMGRTELDDSLERFKAIDTLLRNIQSKKNKDANTKRPKR